ncbi:FG-GAP repeat domain-containing protein [Streptomyces sp. NPDC055815]
MSGRRLAAALLTLSTVTAVTGTLVSAPAFAATTAEGRCAPTAAGLLPVGAEIVSTGAYGYVTTCTDENGATALEWHHTDGTVSTLSGPNGYDSSSDYMLTGDGSMFTAYNPTTSDYAGLNMGVFGYDAQLVGAAGPVLYVSAPAPAGAAGRELWQLESVNGFVRKTKITNTVSNDVFDYTELAHKVVGVGKDPNGRPAVLVLIKGTRDIGVGEPTPYALEALVPVSTGTPIQQEWTHGAGDWDAGATGALTEKYRAWVTNVAGAPQLRVRGSGGFSKDLVLSDVAGQPVVAGIIGDTVLYAARRDPHAGPEVLTPLYAVNVTTGGVGSKVLENVSSVAHAPDGGLLVRGTSSTADGLFRIGADGTGRPAVATVVETGRQLGVKVTGSSVPASVNLEKATAVPMEWSLSRGDADVEVTLRHAATGRKFVAHLVNPVSGNTFRLTWDGVLEGISAPNGAYTWSMKATPSDGTAPATVSGGFTVTRKANPHDVNDNGSTDVLARDASGVLWRDDLFDWPTGGRADTAKRTKVGTGWGIYRQIEAVGTIAGSPVGDLIALDGTGVLWQYQGKGDGTFATRVKVGSGWGGYTKLAGGSDLNGDGRSDLLATDAAGGLWFYKGTGSATAPYATRVKVGGGWGIYNQITAVGNIAGSSAGDLVARDTSGVLWLYQGNGTGGFGTRVKVGSGWGAFSQLVGAGDIDTDGRPDLIAYGAGGTYVYRSTGSATAPFTRMATSLYAGEGSKFNSVA